MVKNVQLKLYRVTMPYDSSDARLKAKLEESYTWHNIAGIWNMYWKKRDLKNIISLWKFMKYLCTLLDPKDTDIYILHFWSNSVDAFVQYDLYIDLYAFGQPKNKNSITLIYAKCSWCRWHTRSNKKKENGEDTFSNGDQGRLSEMLETWR